MSKISTMVYKLRRSVKCNNSTVHALINNGRKSEAAVYH